MFLVRGDINEVIILTKMTWPINDNSHKNDLVYK